MSEAVTGYHLVPYQRHAQHAGPCGSGYPLPRNPGECSLL